MDATKNFFVGLATFSTAVMLGLSAVALGAALISGVTGA